MVRNNGHLLPEINGWLAEASQLPAVGLDVFERAGVVVCSSCTCLCSAQAESALINSSHSHNQGRRRQYVDSHSSLRPSVRFSSLILHPI